MTAAQNVRELGQSIWLDYIHRDDLKDGTFQAYLDDGVMGVTSNPSIFQKAIGNSATYDETIARLIDLEAADIYEKLAVEDIQTAADMLRPIYDKTDGGDGFVSLEVSPLLASNTDETIAEAKRLYAEVDRPNVMIKIPATEAGLPAIEACIADGINVNITLIFAIENYKQVAEAYIRGLERRLEAGEDVTAIASVASFFLSRIDVMVDRMLQNNMRAAQVHGDTDRIAANRQLLGQAAIASARLAYREFQRIFQGSRFASLREAGASVQRPLWASTSTKDPAYSDVMYVDNLIGEHTVNTLPPKTFNAFNDHGTVESTLTRNLEQFLEPDVVMDKLAEIGFDMKQITDQLQVDGVEAFIESFETLIDQVAAKRTVIRTGIIERQLTAPGIYNNDVQQALKKLDDEFVVGRIWTKEGSLWKDHGPTITKIENRLGWLDVMETMDYDRLKTLQASIRESNFEDIVLLGMGGSSLAPEVMFRTFGRQAGFPRLTVLDSTDPGRIADIENAIDLSKTLFIVASKSGGTVETISFYKYFFQQTGGNGDQFIAITDPDSNLQRIAEEQNFRDMFLNPADIGGRYSALSYFGLVPAALIGLDLDRIHENASRMIEACADNIPVNYHPGVSLGATIGTLALAQKERNKLCIFCTQAIASFGDWAEQLVAESLGKEGKGVLPVVGATVGNPHDYASDRLFVYLRVDDDTDMQTMDRGIKALREAGHPRFMQCIADPYGIFGEFFRWEFATAVAGHMLAVNPFDEPNVTEAKEATKSLLKTYTETGSLPQPDPIMQEDNLRLYASESTISPLRELCRSHAYDDNSLKEVLAAQIIGTHAGDYFALLAYLTPNDTHDEALTNVQRRLRHVTRRAVTVGYGPRYLHSTGQLHKGGDDTGVFIQITTDSAADIDIPEADYSFGTLFAAQAAGDLNALQKHDRRAMRLHIEGDVVAGLEKVLAAIEFVENRRQ